MMHSASVPPRNDKPGAERWFRDHCSLGTVVQEYEQEDTPNRNRQKPSALMEKGVPPERPVCVMGGCSSPLLSSQVTSLVSFSGNGFSLVDCSVFSRSFRSRHVPRPGAH